MSTISIKPKQSGLSILARHSMLQALYDSSARDPPPRCHPGTRYDYIDRITHWALNSDGREHRMIWIYGPAGVGKSAVSQSCAEAIAKSGKLGAAFFFSMPNKWDKPNYLFTTISYQLAIRHASYRQIMNTMLQNDPTLVSKSIRRQFWDLIVTPFAQLRAQGEDVDEMVIIIDDLDQCASSEAQCEIIDIVAKSIRDQATPFLWVITSRPEVHIRAKFTSPHTSPLSTHIELPVSRDIDHEITRFLMDELREIRIEHGLPESWSSERQIGTLVDLSAGLFVYASIIIRFIGDKDSSGPVHQLQAVLALEEQSAKESGDHPLPEFNLFYKLIMMGQSQKVLPTIQKILFTTTLYGGTSAIINANLVGLSETEFRNTCQLLCSVLVLEGHRDPRIEFYSPSFMQFLLDPKRSRGFCIKPDCAVGLGMELLDRLRMVCAESDSHETIEIPITWPEPTKQEAFSFTVHAFLDLCQSVPFSEKMLIALTTFNYAKIPVLFGFQNTYQRGIDVNRLLQNIPKDFHGKIIRPYPRVLFEAATLEKPHSDFVWSRPYVLGHGKNKALLWPDRDGSWISPYPKSHVASIAKSIKNIIMVRNIVDTTFRTTADCQLSRFV